MPRAHPQDQSAIGLRMTERAIDIHDMAGFWPKLMSGSIQQDAILVFSEIKGDFPHWEMHPNGEELFIVLEGAIDAILEEAGGETVTRVEAGELFVVPRGIWHRAEMAAPGRMIFLTFGEGTEHRPLEVSPG